MELHFLKDIVFFSEILYVVVPSYHLFVFFEWIDNSIDSCQELLYRFISQLVAGGVGKWKESQMNYLRGAPALRPLLEEMDGTYEDNKHVGL